MGRFRVTSEQTPDGPAYYVYDDLTGARIGDFGTQLWAERYAELMEEQAKKEESK